MNLRSWLAGAIGLVAGVGCPSAPPEAHDDHDEPAHDPHHQDEPAHDGPPRRVQISDAVVAAAGIETAAATPQRIAPTVELVGEVVPDPDRTARVGARIAGIVESVAVRPGDKVDEGAVLAVIRAPGLQALRASQAALKAKASSARANADRLRTLADKRMAAQQEATAADAEASALDAEARASSERLRALGVGRSRRGPILFEVRAPLAGVVIDRGVVAGDPVTETSTVAKVVALDEVWFMAHIFEGDVRRVQEGSPVVVVLNAYPDDPFDGEVESISYEVDANARTLSARIPLVNREEKLRLGLFGQANVVVASEPARATLAVPRAAVTDVLGQTVVFVRHPDGHFELHAVTLGRSDSHFVEVLHGLRVGEDVVVAGAFNIKSALLRETFGEDGH